MRVYVIIYLHTAVGIGTPKTPRTSATSFQQSQSTPKSKPTSQGQTTQQSKPTSQGQTTQQSNGVVEMDDDFNLMEAEQSMLSQ